MDVPDFAALHQSCAPQVHQQTMAAIVKTESGFKPLAIGINKASVRLERQPATKDEAISTARWLISSGYNIDMGYAQINSANLKWLGLTIEEVFDACKNLAAGARILTDNYKAALRKIEDPQEALRAALSAYNTGNYTAGLRNGYVQKVSANAAAVPAVTPQAAPSTPPIPLTSSAPVRPQGAPGLAPTQIKGPTGQRQQERAKRPEFVYGTPSTEPSNPSPLVYH